MPRLEFKGRSVVWNHHLAVPYRELIPRADKSLTDKVSLHDNLIIHGDNLHALKALLPNYAGKVKCIYIDPPYNTGNEGWKYNDNVNSPVMQEWLGKEVSRDDQDRHDKWLCMMTPRLKLLRELLSEDGVIFVSIDDIEVHNLRELFDMVFGEDNFLATIIWQKKYAVSNDATGIPEMHDYLVAYQKSSFFKRNLLVRSEKMNKPYKHDDNDGRGLWRSDNLLVKSFSDPFVFPIQNPKTGKQFLPPKGKCWRASEDTVKNWIAENRIYFGKSGKGAPQLKRYLQEVQQGSVPTTWWPFEMAGHNDAAKKEIESLFGFKVPFDTPKPSSLIELVLKISTSSSSLILDSFAGSGTTAHAVLALNIEDGGNRRFILVECEDYADSITAERVRRVIKGVPNAKDPNLKAGLGGTFSYYDLGDPIDEQRLLSGENLPSFEELARYIFHTATGEEIDPPKVDMQTGYLGSAREYDIYMLYQPDVEYLRSTALTHEFAKNLPPHKGRTRVIFAPARYISRDFMNEFKVEFCQLPYELHRSLG